MPECDPFLSQLSCSDEGWSVCLWVKPAAFVPVKSNILREGKVAGPGRGSKGKAALEIPSECFWPSTRVGFLAG